MSSAKPSMRRGLVAASIFLAGFSALAIGFRVNPTTEHGSGNRVPATTLYAVHVIGCASHQLHYPVPLSLYVPGDYVVLLTPEQYATISAAFVAVGEADETVRSMMYLP